MIDLFKNICKTLDLGMLKTFEKVEGGLTNKMYKVTTTKSIYAIKIINENNIQKNPDLIKNIEKSEDIANTVKQNNINAVCAIKFNNKYIQKIDNINFLVYNWCSGKVLLTKEINLKHVKIISNQLTNIHKIEVNKDIDYKIYKKINYKKYFDLLKNNEEEWSKDFRNNFNELCKIYNKVYSCYEKLSNQKSYVHKDLNRKNIIWNKDIPYIIDWETATIGNPSLDFFNSAWFLTDDIDIDKFYVFANEYLFINKLEDDIKISSYAAIIDECNWLEFSLKRALGIQSNDVDEINLGKKSITPSLNEILNYYDKVPLMIKIINKVLS